MKEKSDQPAPKEAAPLFVGGQVAPPKRRKFPWLKIALVIVVIAVIGTLGWWAWDRQVNYLNISHLKSDNVRISDAKDLVKQPVPNDPKDRAVYYATIATELQAGKEYTYAERFLLTAQKVSDENKLDKKEYRFYVGLADLYRIMKNDNKAKEYDQKEQKFLEANYSKETLDQMKETKPDEPRGR